MAEDRRTLTILMPCLDEEKTIGACIDKARAFLEANGYHGEILIADNGSSDRSASVAESRGARVVHVPDRGYGSALLGGIKAAGGDYIIMGDADGSYDFSDLQTFVDALDQGVDLVMGNRFLGGIEPGAMPFSHRYIGNPMISGIGRRLFHTDIGDFCCGLRAFRTDSILRLGLHTTGMEFALEMIVKAVRCKLKIAEAPCRLYPDGRDRPPHLRTLHDGWRSLKFLLSAFFPHDSF